MMERTSMITQLPLERELELIRLTKAGNSEAARELLEQYEPALKGAAYKYSPYLDQNERDSAIHFGFIEAVFKFDPAKHDRLANVIKYALNDELKYEKGTSEVIRIPDRTAQRVCDQIKVGHFSTRSRPFQRPDSGHVSMKNRPVSPNGSRPLMITT